jgi:hypothetical protein
MSIFKLANDHPLTQAGLRCVHLVETAEQGLRLGDVVFEFPFGRIVDTGMACRRDGNSPAGSRSYERPQGSHCREGGLQRSTPGSRGRKGHALQAGGLGQISSLRDVGAPRRTAYQLLYSREREHPAEHSAGLMPMPVRARRCRCGWSSSTAGSCSAYLTTAAPSGRRVADRLRRAKIRTVPPQPRCANLNRLVSVVRDSNRYLSRRVDLSGKKRAVQTSTGRLRQSGAQASCDTGRVRLQCTALAVFSRIIAIRPRS